MSLTPVSDDFEFDVLLKDALVGHELESPAPEHERQVREQLLARCVAVSRRRSAALRWARNVIALAVAAAVLAAVLMLRNPTASAWDELRTALHGVPWVHVDVHGPDDMHVESWISARRSVGAARIGQWAVYDDFRSGVRSEYRPDDKTLYQLPLSETLAGSFRDALGILGNLVREESLSPEQAGLTVLSQSKREVGEGDARAIEYTITFRRQNGPETPQTCTIRMNAATHRPETATIKTEGHPSLECRFDYPEDGPRDIYGLGVPADVNVVDRLPSPGLQRVIDGVREGRRHFDDYYAVAVQTANLNHWSTPVLMYKVWRKGDRWRIEQSFMDLADQERINQRKKPADDLDRRAWWFTQAKAERFYPILVCDGVRYYRFQVEFGDQSQRHIEFHVTGAEPHVMRRDPADPLPPLPTAFPEVEGHAAMGLPTLRPDKEVRFDAAPAEGPAATVMVDVEMPARRGQPMKPDLNRFWVDPLRGFLVMKYELIDLDSQLEPVMLGREILSVDRSPSGYFYPTALSWGGNAKIEYFVNFESEIDDAIFSPEATKSVMQE